MNKTHKQEAPSLTDAAKNTKSKVIEILRWTEQQYCDFQFEQGIIFLEYYIGCNTPYGEVLIRSRIFWNWWKNQWNLRDQYFLSHIKNVERSWYPEVWYKITNEGKNLASNIHPNRAVIDLSYETMINEFLTFEKQKS